MLEPITNDVKVQFKLNDITFKRRKQKINQRKYGAKKQK